MPRRRIPPRRATMDYAGFVKEQTSQFPELCHLQHFLTGVYPANKNCVVFSASQRVDVVVVDVSKNPDTFEITHVRDIGKLSIYTDEPIPSSVAMRLFLVTNMTAPVVELLGSAFGCHPHFFLDQMKSIGNEREFHIDEHGRVADRTDDFSYILQTPKSLSDVQSQPYFSILFMRYFQFLRGSRERYDTMRTCPRAYLLDSCQLEERVSGWFTEPADLGDARVGIFLFDGTADRNTGTLDAEYPLNRPLLRPLPRFNPKHTSSHSASSSPPPPSAPLSQSLRSSIVNQLSNPAFRASVLEDPTTILCACLNCIAGEWMEVNVCFDTWSRWDREDRKSVKDNDGLWMIMEALTRCAENLQMLRQTFALIQDFTSPNPTIPAVPTSPQQRVRSSGTTAQRCMRLLERDYTEIIRVMEGHMSSMRQYTAALAAVRSITESEKAIRQADTMAALTGLASFYIPLSFVTSLLGMNVTSFSPTATPLWLFFAIAAPLTVLSLLGVANWGRVVAGCAYLFAAARGSQRNTQRRAR